MNKVFNFIVVLLLLCSLSFSWYMFMTNKKVMSSMNYEIESLNTELTNTKTELQALKSFTDSINRWFDVNVVEAIISNTRSWFEWWFQSIKSYLIDLNKEVKTLKENQAIILTKIDKYENMTKWIDPKQNIKAMIDESKNSWNKWLDQIYDVQASVRNLTNRIQELEQKIQLINSNTSN